MVLMMVKCGLRISEVIKLKIKDINFVDNVIHVIGGKGAKDRNVSLPSDVKEKLQEYLKGSHIDMCDPKIKRDGGGCRGSLLLQDV